ncbi:hypothetical protein BV22DRAFT_472160 [Leucogyrophana mollusca]|uniref:Uncharacterized protein n=1 Tax=Leucogyrophana mollusca TaxID=85980 RepID=A0ACB8BI77_9AGAM|nr:hypothetical protein BV22DRAFT_472160 [Leucogyrophana mollusca]
MQITRWVSMRFTKPKPDLLAVEIDTPRSSDLSCLQESGTSRLIAAQVVACSVSDISFSCFLVYLRRRSESLIIKDGIFNACTRPQCLQHNECANYAVLRIIGVSGLRTFSHHPTFHALDSCTLSVSLHFFERS